MKGITAEEKIKAVNRHLENHESFRTIAYSIGVDPSTVREWCRNYESMGTEAFIKRNQKKYTLELKEAAVEYYLSGKGSQYEVCKLFHIPSTLPLRQWIKMYNSHGLKGSPGGGTKKTMTKGRKTTFDERLKIVADHLISGSTYMETAEKYGISYQQIYQWIQKYKTNGIDGLKDKRGRSRTSKEMTELERIKAENNILKAQLERKELEIRFLKKVEEIERRRS